MCQARLERFNRNQKADGPARHTIRLPKAYTEASRKGASDLLAAAPYSILEIKPGGLVYTVQHIDSGFVSNVSVTRMIPAAPGLDTTTAVDFPEPWRQLHPEREDRRSDRTVPSPGGPRTTRTQSETHSATKTGKSTKATAQTYTWASRYR